MDIGAVIAVIIWFAIAIIARLNIPILSAVFRWWWNVSFSIAAYIPFCGWMSHLIITKGDSAAKKQKDENVTIDVPIEKNILLLMVINKNLI